MALEHAQQVMLAQIDVAHDVIIPVIAPTHMAGALSSSASLACKSLACKSLASV
jgi:hypothetical protein